MPEENGFLKTGETFSIKDLMYAMLIESDNTAAVTLSDLMDYGFISLMNVKAEELGMSNSKFFDATGLDTLASFHLNSL